MTKTAEPQIAQCDREAAAELCEAWRGNAGDTGDIRSGALEDWHAVRAFARHRITAWNTRLAAGGEGADEYTGAPPPHWKPNDGHDRHPQTAEEWDYRNDPCGPGRRDIGELRLNFAMDYADPRAPAEMALVHRIDIMRLEGELTHKRAYFDNHRLKCPANRDAIRREAFEEACAIFEEVIDQGYPTPPNKVDQCAHGRFGWEDCITCYDDALTAAVARVRAIPVRDDRKDG